MRRMSKAVKGFPANLPHRLRHDAPAPIILCQPVTQLSGFFVYIVLSGDADTAGGPAVDGDGPHELPGFALSDAVFHKPLRVRQGVGVGKDVPQVAGYLPVVGVFWPRRRRPIAATLSGQSPYLFLPKFFMGLPALHQGGGVWVVGEGLVDGSQMVVCQAERISVFSRVMEPRLRQ